MITGSCDDIHANNTVGDIMDSSGCDVSDCHGYWYTNVAMGDGQETPPY